MLQRDWTIYRALTAAFQKTVKSTHEQMRQRENSISFLAHESKFWQLAIDLALSKKSVKAEDFLRYVWGDMCGTGSEYFTETQAKAVQVSLVKEGRLEEAIGALMGRRKRGINSMREERNWTLQVRFLQIVADGWTWEQVVFGGLLESSLEPRNYDNYRLRENCLSMLVANGGEKEARLLLEFSRLAPTETLKECLAALSGFVEQEPILTKDGGEIHMGAGRYGRVGGGVIGKETQGEIAQFICSKADANDDLELSEAVLSALRYMSRADTKGALRTLVNHPSKKVAGGAAEILRLMGEVVAVPKKAGPVKYRLLVNEKPNANREMYWTIVSGSGGGTGSWQKTDADGVLEISRDHFLNRERPAKRIFAQNSNISETDTPMFAVELPLPSGGDEVTAINIPATAFDLNLVLPRELPEFLGQKMRLRMNYQSGEKDYSYELEPRFNMTLAVAGQIHFPALMPGKYQVTLSVPGTTGWRGEIDVVAKESRVVLSKATDVKCKLKPPQNWPPTASFYPQANLLRDGKICNNERPVTEDRMYVYQALLPGKYTLRFSSSTEMIKAGYSEIYEKIPLAAKSIGFEVSEDLPMELDLGEIDFGT
jgi:hypothetical protein